MLHVLTTNGWEQMRWDRLNDGDWAMHVIDTSALTTDQVAEQVQTWCRRAVGGRVPLMRVRPGLC
jgi:hypothetical protein